jgi:hypothetical protein
MHLGPRRRLVCGFEEDRCTPERSGAALSSSTLPTALSPPSYSRSAVDPSPIAEELTPAGQPLGRRCGWPLAHSRRFALWWPQDRRLPQLKLCGTRLLSATRPSKLINGCQGHPLFCLSPGTAQRQRNPEEKRLNAQSLYSADISRQL